MERTLPPHPAPTADTIFALSSGRPPAAVAVIRISGAGAQAAASRLAGRLPPPRRASLRTLRDAGGAPLDQALVIVFPGPATATGEDLVELHLHGGRAIVAAVERALAACPALRPAGAGEFTRRALENGRIDLAQAAGLADLLEAETEAQRRAALAASEGAVSRAVRGWMARVSAAAAEVEAALDFSDEADVEEATRADIVAALESLRADMDEALARPAVERLRDGALVVIAGPPNAGKSSLFNAMLARDAAIVTPISGTTRDVLEASVTRDGAVYRLADTAGLATETDDPVERIGIARARDIAAAADVLLWLGDPAAAPVGALPVHARCDLPERAAVPPGSVAISVHDPATIEHLWAMVARATALRYPADAALLHVEQRRSVAEARSAIAAAIMQADALLIAEHLRLASRTLGSVIGVDATEAMLDSLFGRFCIGK